MDPGRTTAPDDAGAKEVRPLRFERLRSASALPCGAAAATLYGLWQLVVEQKFFLHTLLAQRVSSRRVPQLPLGYRNVLELKLIMFWQQVSQNPEALKKRQFGVYERIRARLDAHGLPHREAAPVREYDAEDLHPDVFYREHVKKGVPCVIRRFYPGELERFRLGALADRFPDAIAQVLDIREKKIKSVPLSEVHADGRRKYIPQQALLDQDPGMRDFFEVDRVRPYFPIMGRPTGPVAAFLIIGLGRGLNANFHCEESPNWYMAVSGSKHWTLVEAQHSWLMYPAAAGDGMRRFSEFKAGADGTPQDELRYPLFDYVPQVEFDLHSGDVLFFPAWMWHKTINLDDEGLGVTCRFSSPAAMSNRYFRALQLISPAFWRSSVQVVAGKVRGDAGGLEEAGGFNEQEVSLY